MPHPTRAGVDETATLSPSAKRGVGPLYGEAELHQFATEINQSADAMVIFADSPNPVVRQKALDILAEAERRYRVTTNAVTAHAAQQNKTVLVFRHARVTRAEVIEELRHLEWARMGNWNKELPGLLSAFELRELDAAAHFSNLLAAGAITPAEFEETITNLAHHLSRPDKPVSPEEARTILERLMT